MNAPQVQGPTEVSAAIFKFLVSARFTDKYTAIDWLNDPARKIDRPHLRTLILNALKTDFSIEAEKIYDDPSIADTRAWLLSALGRVSSDDDVATGEISRYVDV